MGETVFQKTEWDHQLAPSIEDQTFLQLMDKGFHRDETCSWVALLPFPSAKKTPPKQLTICIPKSSSLRRNLERKPTMKAHFLRFMQGILNNRHAELAPPLEEGREVWYLPIFGVFGVTTTLTMTWWSTICVSTCLDTARRRLLQCMDYREKPKKGRKTLTVMFVTSYVDDALRSFPTETEAVDVLKKSPEPVSMLQHQVPQDCLQ